MAHDEKKLTRLNPQIAMSVLKPDKRIGLVVVLTGYGKGKTSSALGMLMRACGHGMKACVLQFMKGDLFTGEWEAVKKIDCDVEIVAGGMGFCGIQGNPYPHDRHREAAQSTLLMAKERILSGKYDLIILDEINNAVHLKLVDLEQVIDLIESKPPLLHLVLTGRDAAPEVIQRADTVSEVREIAHAWRKGIEPQPGVDF
ncbi:MAG TPA: cob(I)yrinic acid a,c-diamide adenosyltransferase [Syntrophobacteraceae bacterium]|nr:cob(I)yrinic acid a,c-diamide adenosyltransferase [Syntrophobacteraceae bacterium]